MANRYPMVLKVIHDLHMLKSFMICTCQSNFCASRGRIIPRRKNYSKTSSALVCSSLLFTPKARAEGGLAHLAVACTDASPRPEVECRRRSGHRGAASALQDAVRRRRRKRTSQTWLVTVEFRNIQCPRSIASLVAVASKSFVAWHRSPSSRLQAPWWRKACARHAT
jgi:hypothetical protein